MRGKWWRWLAAAVLVLAAGLGGAWLWADREDADLAAMRQEEGCDYAQLSQGVTHYALSGPEAGPRVVLVHGATVPLWAWDAQAPALARAGFRVLRYDAWGRGLSDRPDIKYERGDYVRQLAELLRRVGWAGRPVHLVGLSLGAAVAAEFTARHPARVRRLALISPVVHGVAGNPLVELAPIPVVGPLVLRLVGVPKIVARAKALLGGGQAARRYGALFERQTRVPGFERSLLRLLRGDMFADFAPTYAQVGRAGLPVLVIWGAQDTEITRQAVHRLLAATPQARLEVLRQAGHQAVAQAPLEVNRLLAGFLKEAEQK